MSLVALIPIIANGISLAEKILERSEPENAKKLKEAKLEKIEVRSKLRDELSKKVVDQNDGYVQSLLQSETKLDETIAVYQEMADVALIELLNSN